MKIGLKLMYFFSAFMFVGSWLIANHYSPWTAFYNEFLAAPALFALAIATYGVKEPVPFPRPAILVALLALVPFIQLTFGLIGFFGDAVITACYLAALALSIVVGSRLTRAWGERFVEVLAWICLLGAIGSVVLALHQWLGLRQLGVWLMDIPPGGRPYANLAQPNNLSTLFCLGLISAMYLRERGQFGTVVLALFALLLLAGLAMTRSRTAIFIVMVIAGWVFWGRKQFGLKCSPLEVVVAGVVFAVLWAGWPTVSDWLYLSAESTFSRMQAMYTGEIRWTLWQQLLDALWRQPLFGYGWNQVSVAHMTVVAEYPNTVPVEYAHNIVLDVLIWNGLILGGVILAVVGWWFVSGMKKVRSLESWFALLFALVIATHGLFEYPHAYLYFLIPAGLCVGVVCSQAQAGLRSMSRQVYVAVIAVGVGLVGWIFVEYQAIEADYRLMRFESIGLEQRSPHAQAPKIMLLTQLAEFIRYARTPAREHMPEREIRWMGSIAHRYPYPPSLMRYTLALGLNHRPQEASLELLRLKKIQPADRFDEVRSVWPSLVDRYPQLGNVTLPAD